MTGEGEGERRPARRGREAHAEEVARAMRENLKKRKAKMRAKRAGRGAVDPNAEGERSDGREDALDG